jgi:LPPG:FO 2-phospho-L-lactate transferase
VKVVVLAGGVGAARFLRGVVAAVPAEDVTAIVNVGDDFDHLGLAISPDLDTVLYTLAGRSDEERGWGRADETWNALATVSELGGDDWFRLGDRDLGLHLVRTDALRRGEPLSTVTARLAQALGVAVTLLPATDDRLRTIVETPAGAFTFQEWFVARGHRDPVDGLRFEGDDRAEPAPRALAALDTADVILIAPSNPFVSIRPILAVRALLAALDTRRVPAVAVSPLIGGRAVKGPADAMMTRLAGGTSPQQVADCYKGLIDALVIDEADDDGADIGVRTIVTRTLMDDAAGRLRVADAALEGAAALR